MKEKIIEELKTLIYSDTFLFIYSIIHYASILLSIWLVAEFAIYLFKDLPFNSLSLWLTSGGWFLTFLLQIIMFFDD